MLRNYDDANTISKVVVDRNSIVVGTMTGKILLFDQKTQGLLAEYMGHTRKVTDIWVQHNRAILSTSHDCKIYVKSLSQEFDDQTIELDTRDEELQCIDVVDNQCVPSSLECFVGTMEGKLSLVSKGWLQTSVEHLHNLPDEGAVTQVIYQYGLVLWSTPKQIRVIHFKRGRQKICRIPVPEAKETLPSHLYVSNQMMPKVQLKIDTANRSSIADPNVLMYIAWFNVVKKVRLEYDEKTRKFTGTTVYSKDLGDVFLCGLNTSMMVDHFVTCAFLHEPAPAAQPTQSDEGKPDAEPSPRTMVAQYKAQEQYEQNRRVPHLSINTIHWQRIYSEPLTHFEDYYQDLNYSIAWDPAQQDSVYLHSPETIIKIQQVTPKDRADSLYVKKKFEAAMNVVRSDNHSYMLFKVQNGHLNHLLKTSQLDKLNELLPAYLQGDSDRWTHWLSRIMQCKQLKHFIRLIPTDAQSKNLPPNRLYTQMFMYFVAREDFESFLYMMANMPTFVINQDALIKQAEPFLKKDKSSSDPNLLESLFRLYQLNREFEKAFYVILKKKDRRVFDFLDRQ